jgi:hypothetical protein
MLNNVPHGMGPAQGCGGYVQHMPLSQVKASDLQNVYKSVKQGNAVLHNGKPLFLPAKPTAALIPKKPIHDDTSSVLSGMKDVGKVIVCAVVGMALVAPAVYYGFQKFQVYQCWQRQQVHEKANIPLKQVELNI